VDKRRRRAGIRKTSRAAEMPSMTTALEQRAAYGAIRFIKLRPASSRRA